MQNVHVVEHPLSAHSLTALRDERTTAQDFKTHASIVAKTLLMEATRDLELEPHRIQTPLEEMQGSRLKNDVILVPVLRAGLSMLFAAQEFLPWASAGFIGLERDEQTAIAHEYYQKFPAAIAGKRVIILDPMLATGGSLKDTAQALQEKGAQDIRCVCIVAAPEGIKLMQDHFPEVDIYTAAIDSHLNDKAYIVPGLGDFGDRYFGT